MSDTADESIIASASIGVCGIPGSCGGLSDKFALGTGSGEVGREELGRRCSLRQYEKTVDGGMIASVMALSYS